MCDRHSWYGGLGSFGTEPSKLKRDIQSVSVSTGQLPHQGGNNSGSYVSWCGNPKMAAMQGTMSYEAARRRTQFSWPGLRYQTETVVPFISDMDRARNFTQVPSPESPLSSVYGEDKMYAQEKMPGYMPHEYVHADPHQTMSLTDAQMVQQPYDTKYGLHPVEDYSMGIGGGQYVVNRLTREVEQKPYSMGPSQSFPTKQDAQWAADNLTLPRSMLASKTL